MNHTDQLNRLHDYVGDLERVKDDLETALSEIKLVTINLNRDIAELSAELLEDEARRKEAAESEPGPPPRRCRTCNTELTMRDTGFTRCHTCASARRKEGTQP
jgi:hypothetical protein